MKASVAVGRQRAERRTALEQDIEGLKPRLTTLTEKNESLLCHSLEQSDELSSIQLETAATSNHGLPDKMLCYKRSYHYSLSQDYVDNNFLFELICCASTSTTQELPGNTGHLLKLFNQDKNPGALQRSPNWYRR